MVVIPKWEHEWEISKTQEALHNEISNENQYQRKVWKKHYKEKYNENDCGHYDRIRDLESKLEKEKETYDMLAKDYDAIRKSTQIGDGYKERYEQQKMIACGFSHEIKELEKDLDDMTQERDCARLHEFDQDRYDLQKNRIRDLENKLDKANNQIEKLDKFIDAGEVFNKAMNTPVLDDVSITINGERYKVI
jgi:predicted RNase H-like nuclease (RuvC/YqgF family)